VSGVFHRFAAGLRDNLGALLGGAAILIVILLLPDLTPPPTTPPPIELAHGRIVEVLEPSADGTGPEVVVEILDGPHRGETREGHLQGPSGQIEVPDYAVGDEIIVSLTAQPDGSYVAVSDRWRVPAIAGLVALFAIAVAVVGGWRGIRSLLALALTLALVIKVLLPLILGGWEPVLLAVVTATAITVVTLLLTEGWRPTTLAAALGTFAALTLTAVLAVAATAIAEFTSAQGSEDALFIESLLGLELDLGGLLLAAVILGALGVLDDVTITQAATVHELHQADPRIGWRALFGRSLNVGRSHIAATVNTLVLAYVGAALPLLLLLAAGRQGVLEIVSGEIVAVEIVRALVGSLGIVAAVPLTTAVAVWLVHRGGRRTEPSSGPGQEP
jgi:uncharacterized membrane protein